MASDDWVAFIMAGAIALFGALVIPKEFSRLQSGYHRKRLKNLVVSICITIVAASIVIIQVVSPSQGLFFTNLLFSVLFFLVVLIPCGLDSINEYMSTRLMRDGFFFCVSLFFLYHAFV